MSLDGKVALVAGSSRGIGADMAKYLGRAGARVGVAARTEEVKDRRLPGTIRMFSISFVCLCVLCLFAFVVVVVVFVWCCMLCLFCICVYCL